MSGFSIYHILVGVGLIAGVIAALIARSTKRSAGLWFAIGFVLGPIIFVGVIWLAALG
jgi:uncharacterized membrane protein YhdT